MTDEQTPRWELLPDRAAEFFGLPDDFDRKALKRAYNSWLRRFKPEAHPDEFQRIHAGYKLLEGQLVYGVRSQASVAQPVAALAGGVADAGAPLAEELAAGTPEDAYARRADHPAPVPETYRELALLSDVVDGSRHDFLGWLLEGLKRFPDDAALGALVGAYCRDGATSVEMFERLPDLAAALSPARFAFSSEPIWCRLLRRRPFDEFLQTWEACWAGEQVGDGRAESRARLTLRILSAATWYASDEWLDEQLEWLGEDFALLPEDADETFTRLSMLRDHRAVRDVFRDGGPVHERLDDLIVDLTTLDEVDADRAFLAWQREARDDPMAILTEFPPGLPACAAAYAILEDYCIHAEARLDPDGRGPQRERAVQMADDTLTRIAEETRHSRWLSLWTINSAMSWCVTYPVFAVLLLFASELGARLVSEPQWAPWIFLGSVGPAMWWFHRRVRDWRAGVRFRAAQRCYVHIWRGELLDLMQRSQLPAVIVHGLLEDTPPKGREYGDWASAFLMHDVGLAIWSLANRAG